MLVLLNDCKHIARNRQYYIYTDSSYKDWQRLSSLIWRQVYGFQTPKFPGNASPYFEMVKVIEDTLKMRTLRGLETSGSDTHWSCFISQKNGILFYTAAKASGVDYSKIVRVSFTRRDAAEFSRYGMGQQQQGTEKVGGRRSGRPWPEHGSKRHRSRRGRGRKMIKYTLLLLLL